jgi:hypothetical protein
METRELIHRLQAIRKHRGMTYQDIVDATEAAGQAVSMSTVKRLFGPDSDKYEYRYETTIQPIASVLLDADGPQGYTAEIDALKLIIDLKNELIADMRKEIGQHRAVLAHKNRMEAIMGAAILIMLVIGLVFYFGHTHGVMWA